MKETTRITFQTTDIKRLLKPQDVAAILNVSRSYAYLILQNGRLPSVHLGRSVRVRPEDLRAFIEKSATSGYGNF
jgi:excisionase family DNA binding protein